MQSEPYDANASASSPVEGITLTLTVRQVDYLRELVFEDLKEWADAVHDKAWSASETQGRTTDAADVEDMCSAVRPGSGRPHMAVLDLLGWEHPEHLGMRIERQRERGVTDP